MLAKSYKKKGWDQYAKFNNKGGFNQPYILFKAKNMINKETRRMKWTKVRPIAPGTKHPMKKLLHYVGRAWSFITARIPGDHMVINKTSEVPQFLEQANNELSKLGKIDMRVFDIEACYPNMPQQTIRTALQEIIQRLKQEQREGVWVPKYSDSQQCMWKTRRPTMVWIPFEVMCDVMEFALDNTFIKMPGEQLMKQIKGIPMGDPLSPGMTIGTCAWMEGKWLRKVQEQKQWFKSKRFMDDILIIMARNERWDTEAFLEDFKGSCYETLKLEEGNDGTFLETRYWKLGNKIQYKLKNDNEKEQGKTWRYQHWHSNVPFMQKRATLTACLRKVQQQASAPAAMGTSALDKIAEFRRLRYPESVLWKACNYLGASSGNRTWITVRDALRQHHTVQRPVISS